MTAFDVAGTAPGPAMAPVSDLAPVADLGRRTEPDQTALVADLEAEVARLAREVHQRDQVCQAQQAALADLELARDVARADADAHAEATRAVAEASDAVTARLRAEVDRLTHLLGQAEAQAEQQRAAHGDLAARAGAFDELEGSRAWRVVTAYRSLRSSFTRPG